MYFFSLFWYAIFYPAYNKLINVLRSAMNINSTDFFKCCCAPMVTYEEYIHYLYPANLRKISLFVNDMGDRLEYKGSFIFDEYPDREYLYLILNNLHSQIREEFNDLDEDTLSHLFLIADVMFIDSISHRKKRYFDHENSIRRSPAWNSYI